MLDYESISYITQLISGVLFILALSGLSNPEKASKGNMFGIMGMLLGVAAACLDTKNVSRYWLLAIGAVAGASLGITIVAKVVMTAMPQLVACLHSFVGLAAVLVAYANYYAPDEVYTEKTVEWYLHVCETFLGVFIGIITFTGSLVAYGKLQGIITGAPKGLPLRHLINFLIVVSSLFLLVWMCMHNSVVPLAIMTGIAGFLGIHLVMAIGGADMPVVVSMLNSYSGWAIAASGFMLSNDLMIISGALVGSSGAILSYIMCRAMNRHFLAVIMGGFGTAGSAQTEAVKYQGETVAVTPPEAVEILADAKSVVVVPGYGMAASRAQHAMAELTKVLRAKGCNFRFAIHPVAGRLPGHMNVLLAEARVPYDIVFEMDEINPDLSNTDVALVVGANDIVNPSAQTDPNSPIAGMPVLEVWKAKMCIVMKRSMASGYAGVDNPLFFKENTRMLFGDAKKVLEQVVVSIKERKKFSSVSVA